MTSNTCRPQQWRQHGNESEENKNKKKNIPVGKVRSDSFQVTTYSLL